VAEVNARRSYRSELRAAGARRTGQLILDAARELFTERGYAATSVEQIAARAGVSKPTVFANVGSKRDVLKQLRDRALAGDEEPVSVRDRPWYRGVLAEPDPRHTLRAYARIVTQMLGRAAAIEETLRNAAAADPELRDLWQASEDERRRGAAAIIDALRAKGPLKPGLDRDAATDILWALTSGDSYRRLVDHQHWPVERYERWLADTLCSQLLAAQG
jgi:AcrR family transcriptional regulator